MRMAIAEQLTPDELLALIKAGGNYASIGRSLTPERHRNSVRAYALNVIGQDELDKLKPVYGAHKKAVYAILDATPKRKRPDIAKEVGCTVNMVCAYVRTWKSDRDKALAGTKCSHCKFKADPENPIVYGGWCLRCCFDRLQIPPLAFYENGGALILRDRRDELMAEVRGLMEAVT